MCRRAVNAVFAEESDRHGICYWRHRHEERRAARVRHRCGEVAVEFRPAAARRERRDEARCLGAYVDRSFVAYPESSDVVGDVDITVDRGWRRRQAHADQLLQKFGLQLVAHALDVAAGHDADGDPVIGCQGETDCWPHVLPM